MITDKRVYAVWLSRALTPGGGAFTRLLCDFSSPEEIYHAEEAALRASLGKSRTDLASLLDRSLVDAIKDVRFCDATQTEIVSYFDDAYPARLRKIASPPAVLYVRGNLPSDGMSAVAIVGSRRTTRRGRHETFRIADALAGAGYATVSGLAKGIDGVSAAGALACGGISVAVLAGGVDTVYPRSHESLATAISRNGAIISEFPIGTRPLRYHFPIRNRLIAGLCDSLVLTEGEVKSGSLITARIALREGRKVYALRMKRGDAAELLSSEGAVCADDARALLSAMGITQVQNSALDGVAIDRALFRFGVDVCTEEEETDSLIAEDGAASISVPQTAVSDTSQTASARILACLAGMTDADLDQLSEALDDLSPSKLQSELMILSVSGKVEMLPGGRYRYISA